MQDVLTRVRVTCVWGRKIKDSRLKITLGIDKDVHVEKGIYILQGWLLLYERMFADGGERVGIHV